MEGRGSVDLDNLGGRVRPILFGFLAGARSGWSFRFQASEPVIAGAVRSCSHSFNGGHGG